jgi:hypothetical protein
MSSAWSSLWIPIHSVTSHQLHLFSLFAHTHFFKFLNFAQENATVEFEVVTEADTGKFKAVNVTGVGGTPIVPPAREPRKRRQPRGKKEGDEKGSGDEAGGAPAAAAGDENKASNTEKKSNNRRGRGRRNNNKDGGANNNNAKSDDDQPKAEPKPRDPPFHSIFTEDAKKAIADKSVELGRKSTVDVALGGSRIKLGQGGYAAFADAKGIVGEGTYTCDENAKIVFEWKRAIEYAGGEWKVSDAGKLLKELNLAKGECEPKTVFFRTPPLLLFLLTVLFLVPRV